MTEFFHYEDLTWPEVADLPRDVPLVLPLDSSFDPEKVAAQLGNPLRLGILPSFPFGWRGSGLAVAKSGDWKSRQPLQSRPSSAGAIQSAKADFASVGAISIAELNSQQFQI